MSLTSQSFGWARWAAPLILILVLAAVVGLPSSRYPLTATDTSLFVLLGKSIVDGGAPYREILEFKGPGIFYVYGLITLIPGDHILELRIFDWVWQILTALMIGAVARQLTADARAAPLAAAAYLISYFSQDYWTWGQAEGFLNLPLAAAYWFALRESKSESRARCFGIGCCVALVILLKLPMAIAALGILWIGYAGADKALLPKRALWCAGGFLLPVAVIFGHIYLAGALSDFARIQFAFNPLYVGVLWDNLDLSCIKERLTRPSISAYRGLALVAVAGVLLRGRDFVKPASRVGVVLWFAGALFVSVIHGAFRFYHFLPMLAPLSILAADVALWIWDRARTRPVVFAVALLVAVWPARGVASQTRQHYRDWRAIGNDRDLFAAEREAGKAVGQLSGPDDTIFVWGNSAAIYLEADRKPATRFMTLHMLTGMAAHLGFREDLIRDLKARKPRVIVVQKNRVALERCEFPIEPLAELDAFPALRNLIDSEYSLSREAQTYRIHVRRADL